MGAPGGCESEDLLTRWAAAQGFSLDGLDTLQVFANHLESTLFPALTAFPGMTELLASPRLERAAAILRALPDFSIIVNSDLLIVHTVLKFDGPFESEHEARLAIARRVADVSNNPNDWVPWS